MLGITTTTFGTIEYTLQNLIDGKWLTTRFSGCKGGEHRQSGWQKKQVRPCALILTQRV